MKKTSQEILKDNKLKVTKERVFLLEVLMCAKKPLSIEDLQTDLSDKMNTTTLYRILDRFSEIGLVYKAYFGTGRAYYEYQKSHHHHITCLNCGSQEKVDVCVNEKEVAQKLSTFDSVKNHVLEFFGLCKKCS